MPTLPPELQREIFEVAIRSNHNNAALKLNLSLVAHHVRVWVDRVFYELVALRGQKRVTKFLELVESKPPGFFATVVKTLLLSDTFLSPFPIEYAQASDVLAACGGVQSLQWWTAEELPTVALSSISQLPLQRLSLNLYDVARMIASPVPPAWLTSLTHLDVSVSILIMSLEVSYLEQLRHLPRLTHVALGPLESGTELLCATCPSLQILVILILPGTTLDNANLFDPRVIVTEFPADSKKEWEARHFGLPNIWTYAEGVVAERKRLALPRGD